VRDSADWFSADGKLLLPPEYAGWCGSRSNQTGARARVSSDITNPLPNSRYILDPVLSPAQQRIELTANLGRNVRWFVNDAPVAPQADGRFFWQLAVGQWKLRAVSGMGVAEQTVFVE
jgi:hypothetical protein